MINGEKQPYLGANVSPSILAEIEFRHLIDADERLLAVFDGMLLDEGGRRVGGLSMSDYLLLTNRQLITWARGMWTDTVDGFAWRDVALLDAETWDPYHGRIAFCFRLPAPASRPERRVSVRGAGAPHQPGPDAAEVVNFLDMMPAEDVPIATEMLQWVPEYLAAEDEQALAAVFADTFPAVPRLPRPRLEGWAVQLRPAGCAGPGLGRRPGERLRAAAPRRRGPRERRAGTFCGAGRARWAGPRAAHDLRHGARRAHAADAPR
jgi:hypothetical protein